MNHLSFAVLGTFQLLGLILFPSGYAQAQYGRQGWRQQDAIDIVVGGDFGFHLITGNSAEESTAALLSNRQDFENNKLNYRFGLNYNFGLSPTLSVKAGLRYANPGFTTSPVVAFDPEEDINTVKKQFEPFGSEYRYEYQMFEMPLGVKYSLVNSVCEPYFEAGISTAI
jgi:hypothetical protein